MPIVQLMRTVWKRLWEGANEIISNICFEISALKRNAAILGNSSAI